MSRVKSIIIILMMIMTHYNYGSEVQMRDFLYFYCCLNIINNTILINSAKPHTPEMQLSASAALNTISSMLYLGYLCTLDINNISSMRDRNANLRQVMAEIKHFGQQARININNTSNTDQVHIIRPHFDAYDRSISDAKNIKKQIKFNKDNLELLWKYTIARLCFVAFGSTLCLANMICLL